ncbi:unnamed protein product [Orchesella dallaii]|uniref:Uncharacterized protein n=1 Tax=Orchesella dallaii TaxID=48710 RepID=A0ABP1RUC3_9HEXA
MREFLPNQEVWVKTYSKNEENWSRGKIVRAVGPVSYIVQVGDRRIMRHTDQIRAATIQDNEAIEADEPQVPDPLASPHRSPVRSPPKPPTPITEVPKPEASSSSSATHQEPSCESRKTQGFSYLTMFKIRREENVIYRHTGHEKAFDTIRRLEVIERLTWYGINDPWIVSYITEGQQYVVVEFNGLEIRTT